MVAPIKDSLSPKDQMLLSQVRRNEAEARNFDELSENQILGRRHEAALAQIVEQEAKQRLALAELQVEQAQLEVRSSDLQLEHNEMVLAGERRSEAKEMSLDFNNHVLQITELTETAAHLYILQLSMWERSAPKCDVDVVINSPGGDIGAGMALVDYLRSLRAKGHKVTTKVYGRAYSMGMIILQAGTERVFGRHATGLIHKASYGVSGPSAQHEDIQVLIGIYHDVILDLFAERSKMSKTAMKRRWERTDWYFGAQAALDHGFIDRIE